VAAKVGAARRSKTKVALRGMESPVDGAPPAYHKKLARSGAGHWQAGGPMHRTALLLCLALSFAAPAQEDPDFQFLQSLTQTRYWDLGRPTSIRVTPDGSAVLFLRALPRKPGDAPSSPST